MKLHMCSTVCSSLPTFVSTTVLYRSTSCGCSTSCSCPVSLTVVNAISFERTTYSALENIGNYTEVRLVSSLPFPVDTEVRVSFGCITAIGEHLHSVCICCMYVTSQCVWEWLVSTEPKMLVSSGIVKRD